MASNQIPVAEKARIISETFRVPVEDVERIKGKESCNCTTLETYIKEGNSQIPFEMVREIQKKEVADCSTLELKIRYNDENLGKLPNWVDINVVDSIIWREVNSTWNKFLEPVYTREDIHGACWEHVLLKSKEISKVDVKDYEKFICHLVKWHISNFYYYHKQHSKHINFKVDISPEDGKLIISNKDKINRLPEVIYNLNEVDAEIREEEKFVYIADSNKREHQENYILDTIEEEMDMLNTIKSINDSTIRDLLSIAAYILAQLDSFKGLYDDAVSRMTESKRVKFLELIESKNGKSLDFKKVLKILVGKESNTYLEMIKDYLQELMINSRRFAEV